MNRTINLNSLSSLGARKKGERYNKDIIFKGLDEVLRYYKKADIYIKQIHAENQCRTLVEELTDKWDAEINFLLPGKYFPDIERVNCVLHKIFRLNLYRLPFKLIPRTMICYLAIGVTHNGNYFPAPTIISKHYLPHIIVSGRQVDFTKESLYSFGDYVQVKNDLPIKNKNLPRLLDCIYLRAVGLLQGGHEVMGLTTRCMVCRQKVTLCEMTRMVIDRVELFVSRQGYKSIKFLNSEKQEEARTSPCKC